LEPTSAQNKNLDVDLVQKQTLMWGLKKGGEKKKSGNGMRSFIAGGSLTFVQNPPEWRSVWSGWGSLEKIMGWGTKEPQVLYPKHIEAGRNYEDYLRYCETEKLVLTKTGDEATSLENAGQEGTSLNQASKSKEALIW